MAHPNFHFRPYVILVVIVLTGGALLLGACTDGDGAAPRPAVDSTDTRSHNLMALVGNNPQLRTLREAFRVTALDEKLREAGPYTVFAPTDAAFRNRRPGFDTLLEETYRDTLRRLLRAHIVRGRLQAAGKDDTLQISSLSQDPLTLRRTRHGSLHIDDHAVSRTIEAQNGMLHLIPSVLQPARPDTAGPENDVVLPDPSPE